MKKIFVSIILISSVLIMQHEAFAARKSRGESCSLCGARGQTGSIRDVDTGRAVCDDCSSKNGGKSWNEDKGHYTSPKDM